MYICLECGCEFEQPIKIKEKHNQTAPPFETLYVCPHCKSTDFKNGVSEFCRCCGARLTENQTDFCSESCKNRREKLWKKELKHKKYISDNPIFKFVREIDAYNKKHNARLSYGQFAFLTKNQKGGKKNDKR